MDRDFGLNVSVLSKELKLLLLLMKTSIHKKVNSEWFTGINWSHFLELVRHHRVYPIIFKSLKETSKDWIPPHILEALRQEYHRNTFMMLHLSGEMEQVSRLFSEHKIRPLFLKGPVIAVDLYGDVSLRTSCDLDVLVPIDDLGRTEELLVNLGYKKDDYIESVLNDWKWRHHHITFFHPKKGIKLEIHWRLNPGPAKEPTFDELWERRRVSSITKYPVYFLGKEDLFLFLVSHGARHGWSRLRWLGDIDQVVRRGLDWDGVYFLLKKYQYHYVGGQALLLAIELLGSPKVEQMKPLIGGTRPNKLAQEALFYLKQMVNLHTIPVPEEVARYHKRHLFSLMSPQQKILFSMSLFYPYPEDAKTLPLPESLHLLYFPLRPVLWIWRKTRKQAVSSGG